MKVGLFIPCYVDQCYPNVGLATVDLLERHGVEVDYPEDQTCCGQPMANSGLGDAARPLAERFLRIFGDYDHVVCPSGAAHERAGAEIVTAADMSCLMHLDGLIRRDRRPLRVMHVAEILAAAAES
ncbi:MAG TPA: heterodisulfide reductase-related iron-sulfur binding cluster [Kofleriaceae bacterium]|jgi:Fe-S oxidoreductase|nr:heterodisulfide reductase-related iron-sulfur binding cluster [Kofleriaceae bacterium]